MMQQKIYIYLLFSFTYMMENEGEKLSGLKERIKKLAEKRRSEILVKKEEPLNSVVDESQKSQRSQREKSVHIDDEIVEIEDQISQQQFKSESDFFQVNSNSKIPSEKNENFSPSLSDESELDIIREMDELNCDQDDMSEMNEEDERGKKFQELSEGHQKIKEFADYLDRFEERRKKKYDSGALDLGVRYLHEVVFQCVKVGILPKTALHSLKDRQISVQLDFVKKFSQNNLKQFDFEKHKFTPLDHRRLCQLLIVHNKDGYTFGQSVYLLFKDITDFCVQIYKMASSDYKILCKSIDQTYSRQFWMEIENTSMKHPYETVKKIEPLRQQLEPISFIDTSSYFHLDPSPFFHSKANQYEKYFPKVTERPKKKKMTLKEKYGKVLENDNQQEKEEDFSFNEEEEKPKKKRKKSGKSQDSSEDNIKDLYSGFSNDIFCDNSLSSEIKNLKKEYEEEVVKKKKQAKKQSKTPPKSQLKGQGKTPAKKQKKKNKFESDFAERDQIFFDEEEDEEIDEDFSEDDDESLKKRRKLNQDDS